MSHKQAKRMRQAAADQAEKGVGAPWVTEGNQLSGSPQCHDCAFRKDSKEMRQYCSGYGEGLTGGRDDIFNLGVNISMALRGETKLQPFYCHHLAGDIDVPVDESGTIQYVFDANGIPQGVPVCNGWRAKVEGIKRVLEADGVIPQRKKHQIPKLEREA